MNGKKRAYIFAGHYGSGKTNVAVNYALFLKQSGNTTIADLDIVNPYFRTKDASDVLTENGIRLISSAYAGTNVDTPALPAEAYALVTQKDIYAVFDVGGDDRGALALGRYRDALIEEDSFEMLFVINKYRFLTKTPEDTIEVMHEIESACGMKFTGIVNNSNLGDETTVQTVLDSLEYAKAVSEMTGLDIYMTSVRRDIAEKLSDVPNVFPMDIYVKQT